MRSEVIGLSTIRLNGDFYLVRKCTKGKKKPPLIRPVGEKVEALELVGAGTRTDQGKEVEKKKKGPLIAE